MRCCSRHPEARRRAVAAIALAFALLLAAPAVAATEKPSIESGSAYADPTRDLGAGSPSCREALGREQRESCRRSGSVAHAYPLSSYGIDVRVDFSITDPGKSFLGALGSLAAGLWLGLVFVLKGVLLLLEWTFALDLTGKAMPEAQQTMQRLHHDAFGAPWMVAAISVAGLWGIWRGLVQRRTSETLGGLAATVGLMVLGLLIISQPAATVGHLSRLANDAGAGVLAAGTTGEVGEPRAALAAGMAGIFDQGVRDPWCALEFGSVDYCHEPVKGGQRTTNADLWLRYPAQSREREELFKLTKGDDLDDGPGVVEVVTNPVPSVLGLTGGDEPKLDEDVQRLVTKAPERVRMQEAGGTFPRFALLAVIAVGLSGAAVLFGYLAVHLLFASIKTVLLLLFAPAVLLAPAFGDAGRAVFLVWGKRLAGAIAAKLIYALFLTVVLAATGLVGKLDLGWFGTWLVQSAFWWGTFAMRNELIGFASLGLPRSEGGGAGKALSQGYYAWQLGRAAKAATGAALDRPAQAIGAARQHRADTRTARTTATAALASERLDADARRTLGTEHAVARGGVERRDALRRELRATDRRLRGYDETVAAARAQGHEKPTPTAEQEALLGYRERLRAGIEAPELRGAEEMVRHGARNRATGGDDVSDRDVANYRAVRRRAHELPVDHDANLRAAGVDPDEYRAAPDERRAELRAAVTEHLTRERDLLDAAEPAGQPDPDRAARWLRDDALRVRTAEERARLRDERRQRRTTAGTYRRR